MKENRMNLTGLVVRSISPTISLKNGKCKRELYLEYGNHSYMVGEIVDFPTDFAKLRKGDTLDAVIWVNALNKGKSTFTNLLITSIKINQNENEKDNHTYSSNAYADISNDGNSNTESRNHFGRWKSDTLPLSI
jgi:hypothetical protein